VVDNEAEVRRGVEHVLGLFSELICSKTAFMGLTLLTSWQLVLTIQATSPAFGLAHVLQVYSSLLFMLTSEIWFLALKMADFNQQKQYREQEETFMHSLSPLFAFAYR